MSKNKRSLVASVSLLVILFVFVASCKKTALYHNLTEEDANEIIVVLYESGIKAVKQKEMVQNEVSWNVAVDEDKLAEARQILVRRNLPRKREMGLSGVYKDKGLIPTPDEQKARFLLAMKGEIINSLERIPEVVDADVVINIPTPEEFSGDDDKRPTASVIIKIKPNEEVVSQLTESKLQQFVANSVEDLNARDVSVIISYLNRPSEGEGSRGKLILPETTKKEQKEAKVASGLASVAGIQVSKESATRLKIYLSIFFCILIIISAILVVNVIRTTRMKQEFQALSEGSQGPLLEGEVAHETPQLGAGEGDEFPEEPQA